MNIGDTSKTTEFSADTATTNNEGQELRADGAITFRRRMREWVKKRCERLTMLLALVLIVVSRCIGRRPRPPSHKACEIMLTGRFDSANWILAHLVPLANSKKCTRLWMVSTNPVPQINKVEPVYPPKWLTKIIGATTARLLTFAWAAIWKRPHIVGGFHLIYNGIAAAIVANLVGAKSVYFCVGGTEVANDGVNDEPNCFVRTETEANVARTRRLRIVSSFDTIITMGRRAATFFRENGIEKDIQVVSGGIDSSRFKPSERSPSIDMILTARLALVKRIDVFLQGLRYVVRDIPNVRATIVGDGELREELEQLAIDIGVSNNIEFLGHRDDVEKLLCDSRMFVLTSDLEGLPLSLMEAMMCGLPAVVSDVGDLGDLVQNGINGYLVPRRSPERLADRITELLSDTVKYAAFSDAARDSALKYETKATTKRWDDIIAKLQML